MSGIRDQWRIVQRHPKPRRPIIQPYWLTPGRDADTLNRLSRYLWEAERSHRELVAALPRPIRVRHHCRGRFDLVGWECRLCPEKAFITGWSTPDALAAGLAHLHHHHGCPSWQASGEPCTNACEDCNGWEWKA